MVKYEICPHCKNKFGVKNGKRKMNKRGEKKQYCVCKACGKQFPVKKEALTRTEKRLFSLLYNLVNYETSEDDNLKTVTQACNEEVHSIGKLDLEVTYEDINLNSLEDIKVIICKKDDEIKIIKTYPKQVVITIEDRIKKVEDFLKKFDEPLFDK